MGTQAVDNITGALELFSPMEVDHYRRLTTEAEDAVVRLDSLVVVTRVAATQLSTDLGEVVRIKKHIELIRKQQVGPLNEQVTAINGAWKPAVESLERLEKSCKRKLLAFQQAEDERIAREQAEAQRRQEAAAEQERLALEKAAKARSEKGREKALQDAAAAGHELAVARQAEPMDAPHGFRSEGSSTSRKYRWVFQVADPASVPRKYLVVDEKAIRAAVADGVRQIDGVQIYQEAELATRLSR